jgi:FkbM family methyltransferase
MNPLMKLRPDPLQAAARVVGTALGRDSRLVNAVRPLYEEILARIYGERGVPWTINDESFRIDPRYRHLLSRNWDPEVAAFLAARLKSTALCLDVGANVGVYVLQFCRWTEPDGRIIAFEPNPNTRRVLRTHLAMNGLEDRVEIISEAVSDREGKADFFFAQESGMSRLGKANEMLKETAQSMTVATVTLDNFCQQRVLQPDCVLIDIEGFELHALRGARKMLTACPALHLVVEMHPTLWASADVSVADWLEFFSDTGLHPIPLTGQKDPLTDTGSVYFKRN